MFKILDSRGVHKGYFAVLQSWVLHICLITTMRLCGLQVFVQKFDRPTDNKINKIIVPQKTKVNHVLSGHY